MYKQAWAGSLNNTPSGPRTPTHHSVAKPYCSGLPAADKIENPQQNDRSKQRNCYGTQAEIATHDIAAANYGIQDETGEQRANNSHNDIHQNAAAPANKHASDPAN